VVFQSSHKLLAAYNLLLPEERHTLADKRAAFVQGIADTYPGRLIYGNYPELDDGMFGSLANQQEGSFIYQVRKLNYTLMQIARQKSNLFIWDLAALEHTRAGLFALIPPFRWDAVLCLERIGLPGGFMFFSGAPKKRENKRGIA
jgi:hypothetical protein